MTTTKGERKFIRNMAAGGALGATAGSAGAAIATKGRVKFRPLKPAVTGAAAGAAAGGGAVALRMKNRRKKVSKAMSISAFGIEHGEFSKALTRRQKQQTKQGAQVGAIYGGALAGTHGALQAFDRRKMYHAAARNAAHGKGVARGAMALHAGSRGAAGAAVGAAGFGAIGLATAKKKMSPAAEARRKKAVIS